MIDKQKLIVRLNNSRLIHSLNIDNIPHRQFLDLIVTYDLIISSSKEGMWRRTITNDDMEELMVSEEDLYRLAKKNTKELFPSYVKPLYKVIQILSGLNEEADPDIPAEEMPYVVSNKNNCFGAHVMLYPEIFSDLANKLEADLFILPSSIHEVMAISTKSGVEVSDLTTMVHEINGKEVALNEQLGDSVYYFSRETGEITIAAKYENK